MERDFMGLSSKESLAVVKEEIHHDGCKDSGFTKGSVVKWSFMNNVSALPHLMTFKVRQDDKTIKNVYDSFDASKRDSAGEIQGLTGVNVKQQQFGGIPVALPHSGLPTVGSIGGITGSCLKPSAASAQLTIFYAGTVNVFDGITPEKAQAIMLLAVNLLSASSNMAEAKAQAPADGAPVDHLVNTPPCACLSRPLTVSSHARAQSGSGLTSTEEFLAVKTNGVPTTPVNKVEPQKVANATTMLPSAVPQARKASLARFLEKRKERLMNAAPYNLNKKTEACPTVEHGGANFSASTTSGTNTPSTKQG